MEWPVILLVLLFTTGSIFHQASSFHTGALVNISCEEMMPGYGVSPQTVNPPYDVTYYDVVDSEYKGGEPMEFNISVIEGGPTFKGFFMQFRRYGEDTPVGHFQPDSDPENAKPVDCGAPNSAMTHKDGNNKTHVRLVWTSPDGPGEYVPILTIVQKFDTFWVKQMPEGPFKLVAGDEQVHARARSHGHARGHSHGRGRKPSKPKIKKCFGNCGKRRPSHHFHPRRGASSHCVPFSSAIILVTITAFVYNMHS